MKADYKQWEFLHPILRKSILPTLEGQFGVEFNMTSNWRPDGIHNTGRAVDLSCQDDHFGRLVEDFLNSIFEYDPDRSEMKVCLYHNVGQGKHLHIQCHPNTRLR